MKHYLWALLALFVCGGLLGGCGGGEKFDITMVPFAGTWTGNWAKGQTLEGKASITVPLAGGEVDGTMNDEVNGISGIALSGTIAERKGESVPDRLVADFSGTLIYPGENPRAVSGVFIETKPNSLRHLNITLTETSTGQQHAMHLMIQR